MSNIWEVFTIGELVVSERGLAMGPFGSNITTDNFVPEGVPVIRGKNLIGNQFRENGFVYLSQTKAEELKSAKALPGDLVFTHRGTLGQVALIPTNSKFPEYIISQSQIRARFNPSRVNSRYIHYWFRSPIGQQALLQNTSQTGVPAIAQPTSSIKAIKIALPSLMEQDRIVNVLESLDNQIENNLKLIFVCSQLIDTLFEKYQGRVTRKLAIGRIASVVLGGTPSRTKSEYWNGSIPWVNSGKVNEFRIIEPTEYITEQGLRSSSTKLMPRGSTLIAITGATLGQVSRLEIDACGNQSIVGVIAAEEPLNDYLFNAIKANVDVLVQSATGGAQQHINKANVEELEIGLLDDDQLLDWHYKVQPLLTTIRELLFENKSLICTRDELLPLLLSGAINVKEIAA
jgi:type I restriction enzyme S subunit